MGNTRELYREETGGPGWVKALLIVVLLVSIIPSVVERNGGLNLDAQSIVPATVALVVMGLVWVFLLGLTVVVRTDSIEVGLGKGWPIRTTIDLTEIETLESVTYRPLREFGGWGLRGSRNRRAWTARGDRAVVMTLTDGRRIYLGSDNPERLEGRIRNALGMLTPQS